MKPVATIAVMLGVLCTYAALDSARAQNTTPAVVGAAVAIPGVVRAGAPIERIVTGFDGLDDDEKRAGHRGCRDRNAERDALDLHRVRRHQAQRTLILRDRHDGAANEGARQIELQDDEHHQCQHARHSIR